MARLWQTALIFLALGQLVAANFHTDVVMRGKMGAAHKVLAGKLFRRLDGHDNMSPEDQEKMGKCMMGECAAKFEAADDGGTKGLCDAVDCAKADDNCAPILKMMESSPEMPAGMLDCFCGEGGCEMPEGEEMGEDPSKMCTFYSCATGNDGCKAFMEAPAMGEMGTMGKCLCSDPAIMDFLKAVSDPTGVCKEFFKKEGGRRLDAHDKEDEGGDVEMDICKMSKDAPDGDCAKVLAPGYRKFSAEAGCADMKKDMEKTIDAEKQQCIDDMLAANPEPAAAEASADFAVRAALPGLAGLLLLLAAH